MGNDSGRDWYIDAWDAKGGRAFASRRVKLDSSGNAPEEEPLVGDTVIYVGPPGFEPELLTNVSVALTAGRSGYFVHRVPLEGSEVGFPSARAVAEFVRRGFISGGAGRGGGDEGGEIPTPDGGPPESPNPEKGSVRWLQSKCKLAEKVEKSLGEMGGVTAKEIETQVERVGPSQLSDPVVWGGAELLAAILAAYPRPNQLVWFRAAETLFAALSETEVWYSMAHGPESSAVRSFLASGQYHLPWPVEVLLDEDEWLHPRWWRGHGIWWQQGLHRRAATRVGVNRFESMFLWPLPSYVSRGMYKSVGQLLSSLVATPGRWAEASESIYRVAVFASAYLSSGVGKHGDADSRLAVAQAWLARSMPGYVFEQRLEAAIASVPTMT